MEQTLLLNATYEPLKVVHWQKAITLWCQGKVEVIAVYDREVRSVSFSFKLPSVIRLLRYIKIKRQIDYVPFSRANIYARDEHTCQYCAELFPSADLTFDHVVPVAQGGRKDWENIVTCCIPCNRRKGGRTPDEAGMHLIRMPKRPDKAPAIRITIGLRTRPTVARLLLLERRARRRELTVASAQASPRAHRDPRGPPPSSSRKSVVRPLWGMEGGRHARRGRASTSIPSRRRSASAAAGAARRRSRTR